MKTTAGRVALHERHRASHPTPEQMKDARELVNLLPPLVRRAVDAGMPNTADALQEAVQRIGYELAGMMDKSAAPKDRP